MTDLLRIVDEVRPYRINCKRRRTPLHPLLPGGRRCTRRAGRGLQRARRSSIRTARARAVGPRAARCSGPELRIKGHLRKLPNATDMKGLSEMKLRSFREIVLGT